MSKRCGNCISFNQYGNCPAFCTHEKHQGMIVQNFTCCPEYEPKKVLTTPFDSIKFFLINEYTGEIGIRYICKDCGKEMSTPYSWQFKLPARYKGQSTLSTSGFHFRCEDCTNKRDSK